MVAVVTVAAVRAGVARVEGMVVAEMLAEQLAVATGAVSTVEVVREEQREVATRAVGATVVQRVAPAGAGAG